VTPATKQRVEFAGFLLIGLLAFAAIAFTLYMIYSALAGFWGVEV
jgi:hypothetical protein